VDLKKLPITSEALSFLVRQKGLEPPRAYCPQEPESYFLRLA